MQPHHSLSSVLLQTRRKVVTIWISKPKAFNRTWRFWRWSKFQKHCFMSVDCHLFCRQKDSLVARQKNPKNHWNSKSLQWFRENARVVYWIVCLRDLPESNCFSAETMFTWNTFLMCLIAIRRSRKSGNSRRKGNSLLNKLLRFTSNGISVMQSFDQWFALSLNLMKAPASASFPVSLRELLKLQTPRENTLRHQLCNQ